MSSLTSYLFKRLGIQIKTVASYNHQSLQAEHGIKSLSAILTKHLTKSGDMWIDYLPFATLAHNTFNSPNLSNYSPYELVFGRKPKSLLDLEMDPNIKVSVTYKEYYNRLEQRLKYLQKILLDFKMRCLALLNKDREYFQYNSGDLVYLISPLTSQLRTASRKIMVKYVGPLVVYKIVDLHNYLLMTLDGKLLRGLFEHERIKPAIIKTSEGNVTNLAHLKQVNVNRDNVLVKFPKIKREQDVFKSCGCQKIDNANGESDNATINTLGTQGCVLVCFKTLNKSD